LCVTLTIISFDPLEKTLKSGHTHQPALRLIAALFPKRIDPTLSVGHLENCPTSKAIKASLLIKHPSRAALPFSLVKTR